MTENSFHFSEKDGESFLTIQCPTGDLARLMDLVRDKLLTPILTERLLAQSSEREKPGVSTIPDAVTSFYTRDDIIPDTEEDIPY
jgi:hypothetical protein